MKFEELTKEQVEIVQEYCYNNEDEFRKFIEGWIDARSRGTETVSAEELAYEFCKPRIRNKKIEDLLNE